MIELRFISLKADRENYATPFSLSARINKCFVSPIRIASSF